MWGISVVTIVTAIFVITAFFFHSGVVDIAESRYGINKYSFKVIGILIALIYFTLYSTGLFFSSGSKSIRVIMEIQKSNGKISFSIILLFIFFSISSYYFDKKKEEIFSSSTEYRQEPIKSKKYMIFSMVFIFLVAFGSFYALENNVNEVRKIINKQTTNKKIINEDYLALIISFANISLFYILTILSTGYIYNHGRLFYFKLYKLGLTEELKKNLEILNIETNKNFIEAYVLVETDDSMIIKIYNKDFPAIKVNKDSVLSLIQIEEDKAISEERLKVEHDPKERSENTVKEKKEI